MGKKGRVTWKFNFPSNLSKNGSNDNYFYQFFLRNGTGTFLVSFI